MRVWGAVSIYNKHLAAEQPQPLQELSLQEGQLTWFSPNWYQTVGSLLLDLRSACS